MILTLYTYTQQKYPEIKENTCAVEQHAAYVVCFNPLMYHLRLCIGAAKILMPV